MGKIVFVMDTEEGHIIPSFGLAHSLKSRGHEVVYLSILDNDDLVKEQGFAFHPIFENIYYRGYKKEYIRHALPPGSKQMPNGVLQDSYNQHIAELMNGGLDSLLGQLKADLFIVSTFLQTDILILYYKYHISPVIFTFVLREEGLSPAIEYCDYLSRVSPEEVVIFIDFVISQGIRVDSVAELAEPLNTFCELVVVPQEFDINPIPLKGNVHHIGPSMRKGVTDGDIRKLYGIDRDRKIIYASLGSQPVRHRETCRIFFETMINVMRCVELEGSHLILSIGPDFQTNPLQDVPVNITFVRWAPQIDILMAASLAIIHGGMGTVKECIFYGVPMIVFPLAFDQPFNARRVEHHKLGLRAELEMVSEIDLRSLILTVLESDEIKAGIQKMRSIFTEKENAQEGADIIERLLKTNGVPQAIL